MLLLVRRIIRRRDEKFRLELHFCGGNLHYRAVEDYREYE